MAKVILSFTLLFGVMITVVGCDESDEINHTCLGAADEQEGLVTTTVGITEYGIMYELGTVLVEYNSKDPKQTSIAKSSKDAVHDFFVKKGYTPKVGGLISHDTELINIGESVDPVPLLEKIGAIEGVDAAYLNLLYHTANLLWFKRPISKESAVVPQPKEGLIEVGVTEDGDLYKLGVVLVQYDETTWKLVDITGPPIAAVNNFFINRGYTPRVVGTFSRTEVIEIGECIDALPMLDKLKLIPGVVDARPDILVSEFKRFLGKPVLH